MPFAELNVAINGLRELQARLRHLDVAIIEKVHYALVFEGEPIKTVAQYLCPVRTGYLRSTIYALIEGWILKLGASAHYACYVEFGTRFMRAVRFLSRAVELRLQSLVNAINRAIDRAIREAAH